MTEYEKKRLATIEQNKRRMKELGIEHLVYETKCLMDQKRQKITKEKSNKALSNDVEYVPDEEDGVLQKSGEGENDCLPSITSLRTRSKKVMASKGGNDVKSLDKQPLSTISMSDLVKMRSQSRIIQEQRKKEKSLTPLGQQELSKANGRVSSQGESQERVNMGIIKTLPTHSQQGKEAHRNTSADKGQKKMVPPGSIGVYARMKEKLREQERTSTPTDVFLEPIQLNDMLFNQPMQSIQKRQANCSEVQVFHGDGGRRLDLVDEEENSENSNTYFFEEEGIEPEETEKDVADVANELIHVEDHQNDQLVLQKQKRTRGPSMCKDVHGWTLNDRKPIILNGMGQPIGPDKDTLNKFSRFLGSLARDSSLVPLNKIDWHQVPNKDSIWEYVKTKYIIPEEGKEYVLRSIGALWRSHKCRTKKKLYRPRAKKDVSGKQGETIMPSSQLKDLLNFWNLEEVQKRSRINKESSESQRDRHTTGPVSFARTRHALEQAEKEPPSEARMYYETRKRTSGRTYKTTYEVIEDNINQMKGGQSQKQCKLLGRCTKRVKGPSHSSVLIPDEFLEPYRAQIVKDTAAEIMRTLKQQLPSEIFSQIIPSFEDQSNHDIQQCQDAENGDNEVHHHDVEGTKRTESEEQDYED